HVGKAWQRVDECVQTNVQGTMNLVQSLERVAYERMVYVGTGEIYGDVAVPFREDAAVNPVSPYAVSKYAAELLCRTFHQGRDRPIAMARPFNAYGPAQSPDRIVPELIVRGLRGEDVPMTEGRQTRELNYVEDLLEGLLLLGAADDVDGEVFNLGGGEEHTMREVATIVLGLLDTPSSAKFGTIPERPNEIRRMVSDSGKARARLGWKPTHTLEEGLRATIAWYRAELADPDSPFAL